MAKVFRFEFLRSASFQGADALFDVMKDHAKKHDNKFAQMN